MTETATIPTDILGVPHSVGGALMFLAGRCDRAASWDGSGFSGADTDFGHDMARKFSQYGSFYSEKQFLAAKKLTYKYRKQLARAGFVMEALLEETFTPREARAERIPETVVHGITITLETERAYRATLGLRISDWLPKSQVRIVRAVTLRNQRGETLTCANVEMPAWLARKKGITEPKATSEEAFALFEQTKAEIQAAQATAQ
jgi:hypothetical protein